VVPYCLVFYSGSPYLLGRVLQTQFGTNATTKAEKGINRRQRRILFGFETKRRRGGTSNRGSGVYRMDSRNPRFLCGDAEVGVVWLLLSLVQLANIWS
jgi:hypothetical protein